jgi:phosphatidylglycerophosphate synthase
MSNTNSNNEETDRRPVATRGARWAQAGATALAQAGLSANMISVIGAAASGLGLVALAKAPQADNMFVHAACLVAAALLIQVRLLCNLFDGMVAISTGTQSPVGHLYNEVPDRVSDTFILIGAGLACQAMPFAMHVAWAASLLACATAYLRLLGKSLGTPMFFAGPMAKQHRMAVMTGACVIAAGLAATGFEHGSGWPLYAGLWVVLLGSLWTCARRLRLIGDALQCN